MRSDLGLLFFLSPFSTVLAQTPTRPCDTHDIRPGFGQCPDGLESGTRSLYYYIDASTCVNNGSLVLPAPQTLSCNIDCAKGYKLNVKFHGIGSSIAPNATCEPCNPGYFSLGGGFSISGELGEWKKALWPKALDTWCVGRIGRRYILNGNNCQKWEPSGNGTIITSGNNRGKHNVMSALRLMVVLKKSGYISFRYQSPTPEPNDPVTLLTYDPAYVESEHGKDGLQFTINSIVYLNLQSNVPSWKKVTFPLETGAYVLEWFYWKNRYGDYGKDRAELEIIEISGTEYAELKCTRCPDGTESTKGAMACVSCGRDHYASEEHFGKCMPCPSGTYSYPGAVRRDSCLPRPLCTPSDYTKNFTDCDRTTFTRTLFYNWTHPKICIDKVSGAAELPEKQYNVACEKCQPGMFDNGHGKCLPCDTGEYLPKSSGPHASSCQKCPVGYEAIEEVYYEYWYRWPKGWTSNGGWTLHEDYTYAGGLGNVHRDSDAAQLRLDTFFRQEGSVWFDYQAITVGTYNPEIDTLGFFVDGAPHSTDTLSAVQGNYSIEVPIAKGQHELLWNVRGTNVIRLHRIIVVGVDGGGATSCAACRPGTEPTLSRADCSPCPTGYASPLGIACAECFEDEYSNDGIECKQCGEGTQAEPGSDRCFPKPVLEASRTFDLSALITGFANPGPKHKNSSHGVELTLGSRNYAFSLHRALEPQATPLISERIIKNPLSAFTEITTPALSGHQTCTIDPDYEYFSAGNALYFSEKKPTESVFPVSPFASLSPRSDTANPSRGGGLTIFVSGGDKCDTGQEWQAVLHVECDLDQDDLFSTAKILNDTSNAFHVNDSCSPLHFSMSSKLACPMCTPDDFTKSLSGCGSNGKQTVDWVRTVPCIGDKSSSQQGCSKGFSATVIGFLVAAIVLAVALAVAFGYWLYKLRKRYMEVHSKYVVLRDGYDKNAFDLVPNAGEDQLEEKYEDETKDKDNFAIGDDEEVPDDCLEEPEV